MLRSFLFGIALLCSASAHADSTFAFDFTGSGTGFPNLAIRPNCFFGDPSYPACAEDYTVAWIGAGEVVTSGSADGVYTGADVTFFSSLANIKTASDSNGWTWGPITVTIADGEISSIDFFAVANGGDETLRFSGLDAGYTRQEFHEDRIIASGTVLPILGPAPEPETYALMLAGLLGIVARRRQVHPPPMIGRRRQTL
ncbi:MAG TPA: PEP-CTERM sorting domain-containing protein [Caldimonas sp.]|jgi:hypothetical protein